MSRSLAHPNRFARLLRYARPYRAGWAAILLATLVSTLFSVVSPWPLKVLVDHVLGGAPLPAWLGGIADALPGADARGGLIAWVALAGLVIFAVDSAVDFVLTFLWIRVGQGMVYEVAADAFARVQRRSLLFHSRSSVGVSMARVTGDSGAAHTVVDTLLFAPLHAGGTTVLMLVLMFRMNVPLTLLSLAVAPLIALASVLMGRRLRTTARAHREIESRIQSHVQQTLTGIGVVQAFAQEQREHDRFRSYTDAALVALRRSTLVSSFASLGSGVVAQAGAAAVLWFGARQVLRGELSVGSLFVFLAYLGALQAQLKAFTGIYTGMQTVGAKVDRVCEVLEPEPEVADRPGAIDPGATAGHVVFDNVTFGYEPGRAVLNDVSLEARPGQAVALVGPTGAGKSTLVGMIPRFFDPWHGRVTLDGRDLRDLKLRALRDRVALVLQEPFLFSMSVADNIAYGRPGATREQVERAARDANADGFIEMLPGGYDELLGERGATLSGGERQRLAIARAFLKDAPVLVLDEPTSALDSRTEQLILQAIQRLMKGRTTFIIAHRLSTIRRADTIAVVEDGRIVEVGNHEQLVARGGLYARFHAIQSGGGHEETEPDEPGAVGVLPAG